MLLRTSTTYAPWTVIEAVSKPFARVKIAETVREHLEARIRNAKKAGS
jgi:polyphosphate kinase 2 (PPK2 family)